MSPCHPFRPVPGQCGPNRRGPLPTPPFDPRDYWATRKCVSELSASLEKKLDRADVVDPGAEAEAGKAADAKSTYEELGRILAKLAKKADKATTLAGYGITDAATKTEIAAKADLVDGKVPAAQLPSYVDDVLEYDTMSAFPATGESGKIYVAKDANKTYRWSGTQYVEISPLPVLDDTVTETSSNGVKSSGIWSWVKSLLPHWLTSDYAEPATVASVENKRDKDDLAVYEKVGVGEWMFSVTPSLRDGERIEAYFQDYQWVIQPFDADGNNIGSTRVNGKETDFEITSTTLTLIRADGLEDVSVSATRAYEFRPITDRLATTNGVNAAIAENNVGYRVRESVAWSGAAELALNANGVRSSDETRTGDMLFDQIDGKATKTELAGYLPLTGGYLKGPVYFDAGGRIYTDQGGISVNTHQGLNVYGGGSIVLESNESLTDFDNNPIISATNPAFVSAVRNTPTSGMPEDMPTDWGTFGTVGAALAALAAGLKWCKNILGSLASGYSTFAAWIASKLDRASLMPEYSATSAYSVGAIVWHDGNIYQCKTAIPEGGELWNAEHWELRKLDDFFTNSNSLLTGTIDAEIVEKGTAPDAHLEAPTDERLKLVRADSSVAYDSAKALPYKLTSAIGDRVIATMTLTAASTDITLPTIAANDTTVKDFILDVTNAYAVEGVATDAGINIPRTDFKLVTRDGESLTAVTTVKAGKSAFICFTQKSPVVVDGTTYPCWCVIQLPFGDPS